MFLNVVTSSQVKNVVVVWEVQGVWESFQYNLKSQKVVGSDTAKMHSLLRQLASKVGF